MNTDKEYIYKDIADKIIKSYYDVYNYLGFGYLEKVYKKSPSFEKICENLLNPSHLCANFNKY